MWGLGLVVVIRKASAKGRHGRGSRCKGSEAGQCLLGLRSGKGGTKAGAKQAREGNENRAPGAGGAGSLRPFGSMARAGLYPKGDQSSGGYISKTMK